MFKNYRSYSLSTGVKTKGLAVISTATVTQVLLHKTIVVEKHGRTVTLRNGGYDTVSTRTVINRALEQMAASECYVFRKKGKTYLTQNGVTQEFFDGMFIKVRNQYLSEIGAA